LDSNWRWTHKDGETTNCYTDNEWDSSLCPDGETCASNCAAGAVDKETWEGTYGVKKNGNGVDVGFVTHGPNSVNVGSRSYMMENDKEYKLFDMISKEISFDVDVSNMPCGTNSAIYFSEMEKTGNMSPTNSAGAPYGTGYCDAQCARDLKWVSGKSNSEGWIPSKSDPYNNSGTGNMGACCAEMDLWEANKAATAFTPHPSLIEGLFVCMGDEECGAQDGDRFKAPTDRDGCDINAYRMGCKHFYGDGPEFLVNTQRPFKVVTRFHALDGDLNNIFQFYVQDGQEIRHPMYTFFPDQNSDTVLDDGWCAAQKRSFKDRNSFSEKGGMKAMGEALKRGMVLVISMWDDIAVNMNWLDSSMDNCDPASPGCTRGPCDPADGVPETLREKHPDSSYTVTNIRVGDIGSTWSSSPVAV